MSRIRIVKGNITKITGGNYKMFSKDNIEFHSNKQIIFNAKEGNKKLLLRYMEYLKEEQTAIMSFQCN